MKKFTLEEIGKLAGVSRATVSRVINNYPHVTPEVRERVQQVIDQTGFEPNKIARSLASNRSGIIGLVIPSDTRAVFTDPYFPTLIQGITQATNRYDLTLSLFLFYSMEEEIRTTRTILNTGLIDGLIVTADRKENSFVPQIAERGFRFVFVGRPENDAEISYVNVDNLSGGFLATEHLIGLGRQRIAIITSEHNTAGDDRYAGYRSALAEHGMTLDSRLIGHGDFSMESGYQVMQHLLEESPDAVFAASDTMAIGAQRAIREAGLRVPDDISIVGFDDLAQAAHVEPPLTTIRQPVEQMGTIAVDLLNAVINGTNVSPDQIVLPVELVIRGSCGAKPAH